MRSLSVLAVLALTTLCGACTYLVDRWNDTLDILPLSVTLGPGLYASANVTQFCGAGIGLYTGVTAGWFPTEGPAAREPKHLERFQAGPHMSAGFVLGDFHMPDPGRMTEYGILYWFIPKRRKGIPAGYPFAPTSSLDVTVRAHVALIGARVTFSLGNLADWALGWFGLDIAADDAREWPAPPERGKAQSAPRTRPGPDSARGMQPPLR